MQSYSLTEIQERQNEVLKQATIEPVLLLEESRPGYVILSAHSYQQLIERLSELEDLVLGQLAETTLKTSRLVGAETFTTELQHLANFDASGLSHG